MFKNTDTSGDILPVSYQCVDSLSISIGRVRPEAVVLNNTSLYLRISKSQVFSKNKVKEWARALGVVVVVW